MPHVRCPKCQVRYTVPEGASGKRVKCKKCGAKFVIRTGTAGSSPPARQSPPPPPPPAPAETTPPDLFDAIPVAPDEEIRYAADPPPAASFSAASAGADARSAPTAASGPRHILAFLRDLGRAPAFIFNAGNLITFLGVVLLMVLTQVLGFGAATWCCMFLIVPLVTYGWYMAFQLNTVVNAAGGENEIASLNLTGGWWDDIVVPFARMIVASLVARTAAAIFLLTNWYSALIGSPADLIKQLIYFVAMPWDAILAESSVSVAWTAGALLLAGYFVWPLIILVVAVAGVGGLVRLDLIFATIARVIGPYLLVAGAVYVCEALRFGSQVIVGSMLADLEDGGGDPSWELLLPAVAVPVEVYLTIVQMIVIGKVYHHYKHRFAWSWG